MEVADVFGQEFVRPLMTIVVPGAVAASPFAFLIAHFSPATATYVQTNVGGSTVVLVIVLFALGMLIDNVGALIEAYCWDKKIEKIAPGHMDTWYAYLKTGAEGNLVAHKYLRTILLKLKFEVNTAIALIPCISGGLWLGCVKNALSGTSIVVILVAGIALIIYLLVESYQSAKILSKVRSLIVEKCA